MKTILFTITMLASAQAILSMEAPPAPPAQNAEPGQVLGNLPPELALKVISHLADRYNHKTVQDFTALASTNRAMRTFVYDDKHMRTILRSMRPAHAVDFARKLNKVNKKGHAVVTAAKRSLVHGKVLREAVRTAEQNVVDEVLQTYEADINWPRRVRGETPLIQACKSENIHVVRLLLQHGASLNVQDSLGKTALIYATECGNYQLVRMLIQAGAHLYIKNNYGERALDIARLRGFAHIAGFLNDSSMSANLYKAVSQNNVERARTFAAHTHTDLNWRDANGETALSVAVNAQNRDLVKLLLKTGANPNVTNNEGATPLAWAVYPRDEEKDCEIDIISSLLLAGADPNIKDIHGEAPLFWAAARGNTVVTQMLLQAGAKHSMTNNEGDTARDVAVQNGHTNVTKVLDAALVLGLREDDEQPEQQSPAKKRKI